MRNRNIKLEQINDDYLKKKAANINESDIDKVNKQADKIQQKFNNRGPLSKFMAESKLLIGLIKDYSTNKYRDFPFWVIAVVCFTLLYVLNPIDIIPDVIPFAGQIDDAAVVGVCLYLIEKEIQSYKLWKYGEL